MRANPLSRSFTIIIYSPITTTNLCVPNIFPPVPQPGVDVTLNHTAPLYAGTGLTFTCTVTLDPNVDNGERVMTEWSGLQDIPEE